MKTKIRIMLVEDHPEYREVLEIALAGEPDMEMGGTFGAAEVALRSLRDKGLHRPPDIILLDLSLPGMSGLDAITRLTAALPDVKIIILTQSGKESDVLRAISLGASGYLLKLATVQEIKETIRTVMNGGASLDARIAKFIFNTLKAKAHDEPGKILTSRELEILILLGEGLLKKEIGNRLKISFGTVATHTRHIYEKLNVLNAPAAITQAYRSGILPPNR